MMEWVNVIYALMVYGDMIVASAVPGGLCVKPPFLVLNLHFRFFPAFWGGGGVGC